jgi:protocatechuate 3,4-dioxygenase alpha subunit
MLHRTPPLRETPSQTAGPYVQIGLAPNTADIGGVYPEDLGRSALWPDAPGERIEISGRLFDGDGSPVFDAMIELWQANAEGVYGTQSPGGPAGWGRQSVTDAGAFSFSTIKPGRVKGPDGRPMAPHVSLWIVARGINIGLQTRIYFDDEADANATDWVLSRIPNPARRQTLIARRQTNGLPGYVLDIRLQGESETVFFDF